MNIVLNGGSVGNMNVMENNHHAWGMPLGIGMGMPPATIHFLSYYSNTHIFVRAYLN